MTNGSKCPKCGRAYVRAYWIDAPEWKNKRWRYCNTCKKLTDSRLPTPAAGKPNRRRPNWANKP